MIVFHFTWEFKVQMKSYVADVMCFLFKQSTDYKEDHCKKRDMNQEVKVSLVLWEKQGQGCS